MVARLDDRARHGHAVPEQAWPETDGPRILALARRDPKTQTVILILDATTANSVMFAIAGHADEREAHVREVERFGERLPEGSLCPAPPQLAEEWFPSGQRRAAMP
jgi:hypothetical protein